jgi:hypothetical protein
MNTARYDKTSRRYTFIAVLGITMLPFGNEYLKETSIKLDYGFQELI